MSSYQRDLPWCLKSTGRGFFFAYRKRGKNIELKKKYKMRFKQQRRWWRTITRGHEQKVERKNLCGGSFWCIPYWAHYLLSWCEIWIHWKSPPCSNFVSECKCWVLRVICTIAICHPRTFYSPTLTKFLPQNGNQASEPWEITRK